MIKVSEKQSIKVGVHVRFRRLLDDGAEIIGECTGHEPDGRAIIMTQAGERTYFDFRKGHRLHWISNKPWKPARERLEEPPALIERTVSDDRLHRERLKFRVAAGFAGICFIASCVLVMVVVLTT